MEIQGLEKSEKRTLDIQWVKEHLVCRLVNRKNNEELGLCVRDSRHRWPDRCP